MPLDRDQLNASLSAVRDQLAAVLGQHEREAHNGAPCMPTRAEAIGYLAHCLGVRGIWMVQAVVELVSLDRDCAEPGCDHGHGHAAGTAPDTEGSL